MLHKLLFAIGPPHEAQVDPHRLLNARFANMHGERIRQVGRPIFPRRKRWYLVLRGSRAKTKAKRRGFALPTRPSLPKQSAPRTFALSFFCIANPNQLKHGIREVKASICRALARVPIGRPLTQTQPDKLVTCRGAWSGTHEEMIQLKAHVRSLVSLSLPDLQVVNRPSEQVPDGFSPIRRLPCCQHRSDQRRPRSSTFHENRPGFGGFQSGGTNDLLLVKWFHVEHFAGGAEAERLVDGPGGI